MSGDVSLEVFTFQATYILLFKFKFRNGIHQFEQLNKQNKTKLKWQSIRDLTSGPRIVYPNPVP